VVEQVDATMLVAVVRVDFVLQLVILVVVVH
jgi:hypothetical protein